MNVDFIILGAQKAATSSLQAALRCHPDIYMPEGESAFFEEPDYAYRPWENFGEAHGKGKLGGIKRPDYLCWYKAIDRIAEALPNARFIVVLREPVSRAISSYVYLLRHAHLPCLPLNEGMMHCMDVFDRGDVSSRAWQVVQFGLYGQFLHAWYNHYPRERFLILSQKLVSDDPYLALKLCANHIGVDPSLLPTSRHDNFRIKRTNKGLYDPEMLKIAQIGSRLKTRPIPGTLRREPRSLPLRATGTLISRFAEARAQSRSSTRETLSGNVRDRLAVYYEEDLPLLESACADQSTIYWKS